MREREMHIIQNVGRKIIPRVMKFNANIVLTFLFEVLIHLHSVKNSLKLTWLKLLFCSFMFILFYVLTQPYLVHVVSNIKLHDTDIRFCRWQPLKIHNFFSCDFYFLCLGLIYFSNPCFQLLFCWQN